MMYLIVLDILPMTTCGNICVCFINVLGPIIRYNNYIIIMFTRFLDQNELGLHLTDFIKGWPMTDYRRERQSYERREAKAEMGGLCKERCEEGRRGGRLEEEDTRQSRVEKTSR